jgi:hypothetical protein
LLSAQLFSFEGQSFASKGFSLWDRAERTWDASHRCQKQRAKLKFPMLCLG